MNIWNLATGVKADGAFQFIVYTTNPSEPGDGGDGYTGPPEDNGGTGRQTFKRPGRE